MWSDAPGQVFKHTADVVEEYVCYFLTALGAIALSVRFLTSLGAGDLSCIIAGMRDNCSILCSVCLLNKQPLTRDPYFTIRRTC